MLNAYVYYKIDPTIASKEAIVESIRQVQGLLRPFCQHISVQRRADKPDTWMEVYAGIADREGFTAAMHACALPALLPSERMIEWFVEYV
ncbi:DUF4936 family protein [Burkholderiaceae bacterium DAT-1]|nr:DUF4936 family protein [Burkholderiaceae bacterium DAT-1]